MRIIESTIQKVIQGEQSGFWACLIKMTCIPFSLAYHAVTLLRNFAYDKGWLKIHRINVPVISIGNIVAGGVGKTPVVIKLAQELSQYGVPGIVLRGYRSPAEHGKEPAILSLGNGPQLPAAVVGDEAYLLSRNVPQAIVCVGKNKVSGAQMACKLGADWVLMDDGLQHRRLGRDIELIVVNAADPFGKGYFLPLGYLRDEISALKRADLILISENAGPLSLVNEAKIQKISSAPMIKLRQEISAFLDWDGNPLELNLKEKKVGIFCGIGDPKRFHQSLTRLGIEIVGSLHFPDHLAKDGPKMRKFIKECKEKGAELMLCTEKDQVKLSNMRAAELPLGWVKTMINITHGKEHWDKLLRRKYEQ